MPYKKILVSLACKENENSIIHEAIRLASNLDAELTVLHVQDPAAGKTHMMMDTLPLVAEEDVRKQFRKLGYVQEADEIEVHIAKGSSYPNEIAKATEDAHLLVIGHRCKNRFLSAFIDSVDKRVADLVSCPVLVVPYKKSRKFSLLYSKNQQNNRVNLSPQKSSRSKSLDDSVPSKIPA